MSKEEKITYVISALCAVLVISALCAIFIIAGAVVMKHYELKNKPKLGSIIVMDSEGYQAVWKGGE